MWTYNYTQSTELCHHGIKGMKWGIRRYQNANGSLTVAGKSRYRTSLGTKHRAKKDAKEYARAKMFYGEGAGNRRKLIKAKVNERSKDAGYKQEFDKYLAKQNMAKHASKARAERKVKDAKKRTAKTARGLYHLSMGDAAKVSATATVIFGLAHATCVDKVVKNAAKTKVTELYNSASRVADIYKAKQHLRKMGLDV